jgi:hypothetical protein
MVFWVFAVLFDRQLTDPLFQSRIPYSAAPLVFAPKD